MGPSIPSPTPVTSLNGEEMSHFVIKYPHTRGSKITLRFTFVRVVNLLLFILNTRRSTRKIFVFFLPRQTTILPIRLCSVGTQIVRMTCTCERVRCYNTALIDTLKVWCDNDAQPLLLIVRICMYLDFYFKCSSYLRSFFPITFFLCNSKRVSRDDTNSYFSNHLFYFF